MAAVPPTWPTKFSQPVYQDQAPLWRLGELAGGEVERAAGRIGGGDLAHRGADEQHHDRDADPAEYQNPRPAGVHPEAEGGEDPGDDVDDGEGDREIVECPETAGEFPRISHGVERGVVVEGDGIGASRWRVFVAGWGHSGVGHSRTFLGWTGGIGRGDLIERVEQKRDGSRAAMNRAAPWAALCVSRRARHGQPA